MRWRGNWREPGKLPPHPGQRKVLGGDARERRVRVPEAAMILRGADTPKWSGVAAYHSSPPRYVGDRCKRWLHKVGSCDVRMPRGITGRLRSRRGRPPPVETAPPSATEKVPEQSGQPTRVPALVAGAPRMGSRCWCGGGREALAGPKPARGRKQTSVLPPSCIGVSYSKAWQQGPPHSLGFREDERGRAGKRLFTSPESVT
jgi:hypothetical protein